MQSILPGLKKKKNLNNSISQKSRNSQPSFSEVTLYPLA